MIRGRLFPAVRRRAATAPSAVRDADPITQAGQPDGDNGTRGATAVRSPISGERLYATPTAAAAATDRSGSRLNVEIERLAETTVWAPSV